MKNTEEIKEVAVATEEVVDYGFGDLYIKCTCGNDSLEMAGIQGLQITMPATDKDQINLVCPACGHSIKLYFRRAENVLELMEKRDKMLAAIEEVKGQLQEIGIKEAELSSENNEEESTERE